MFPADTERPQGLLLLSNINYITGARGHHRDHRSNSKCEAVRLKCDDLKVEKGSYSSSKRKPGKLKNQSTLKKKLFLVDEDEYTEN